VQPYTLRDFFKLGVGRRDWFSATFILGPRDMMMERYVTGLIASVVFLAASYATTLRAQSTPPTGTYLSLLSQGFEVKSIIFISTDEATHAAKSLQEAIEEGRVVIVTVQKGAMTARCWVAFTTYATNTARNRQGELLPMNCY
jgi:hypothetical protein